MAMVAERFIQRALSDYKFRGSDVLYNEGGPLPESAKTQIVRAAFKIPDEDKIYFAISGNRNLKFEEKGKGFAIASHGIYYRDESKREGMFTYERFYELEVTRFITYVRIGGFEFDVGFPKKIADLLFSVQIGYKNALSRQWAGL